MYTMYNFELLKEELQLYGVQFDKLFTFKGEFNNRLPSLLFLLILSYTNHV